MSLDKIANPSLLHDRMTRGEPLTPEEQARLASWYAEQDEKENANLTRKTAEANGNDMPSVTQLRLLVKTAKKEILVSVQSLQLLTEQNERLREEVLALQERLHSSDNSLLSQAA